MKRWPGRILAIVSLVGILLAGALMQPSLLPTLPPDQPGLDSLARAAAARAARAMRLVDLPEPRLPPGISVAGLPVGGLTLEEARAWVEQHRLVPLRRPLPLTLDGQTFLLDPARAGLLAHGDPGWASLQSDLRAWPLRRWGVYLDPSFGWDPPFYLDLPLVVEVDLPAVRAALEELARGYDQAPTPLRTAQITDSERIAALGIDPFWFPRQGVLAFFAPRPGRRLDVEASLPAVASMLRTWRRAPVVLSTAVITPPTPSLETLEAALREQVADLPAVVGIYVRDLQSGAEAGVHEDVAFSAASVFKIAILVQAYRVLDAPPGAAVVRDMEAMMIVSDNGAANRLMAFGGEGDAPRGLQRATEMLRRLELADSFMCNTYDGGPRWPGCPPPPRSAAAGEPETVADEVLQTTPRDMGRLLAALYDCSNGRGPLLTEFPGEITAAECQAMIALMRRNADINRLVGGVPDIPVAHKSGWIDDMKADAGIVFSAGRPYVVSVFVWQEGFLDEFESTCWIARLSWVVYSFFNPL